MDAWPRLSLNENGPTTVIFTTRTAEENELNVLNDDFNFELCLRKLSLGEQVKVKNAKHNRIKAISLQLFSRAMLNYSLYSAGVSKTYDPFKNLPLIIDQYGKPSLLSTEEPRIQYNMSSSNNIIALMVQFDGGSPVGIDLSHEFQPSISETKFVQQFEGIFSQQELGQLAAIECISERYAFFNQLWTLKEAFTKFVGCGLNADLASVSFNIGPQRPSLVDPKVSHEQFYKKLKILWQKNIEVDFENLDAQFKSRICDKPVLCQSSVLKSGPKLPVYVSVVGQASFETMRVIEIDMMAIFAYIIDRDSHTQVNSVSCVSPPYTPLIIASTDLEHMKLLTQKHAKYFQLCLNSLPLKAESEDSNKLALVYFTLYGLSILGELEGACDKFEGAQYIYEHLIPLKDDTIQAFRSSQTFALTSKNNEYDLPNLSATFFALASLLALEERFMLRIDRHKVMAFVSRCQLKNGPNKGSFLPVLGPHGDPTGETDLRLCYIAASIRKILGYDKLEPLKRRCDIDVESMRAFILEKVNFNGGMSSFSHTESHSGLTFCGVAALKLIGHKFSQDEQWTQLTIDWLVHRQVDYPAGLYEDGYEYYDEDDIGGFNGRENKFGDTCYSWWVMALLHLIDPSSILLVNEMKACEYLLKKTQHKLMGGFGKDGLAFPDPFHSFLALASLSLCKEHFSDLQIDGLEQLCEIDSGLVITKKARMFMETLW